MASERSNSISWLAWPFVALWRLLTFVLNLTGRLVAGIIGLVLMVVGFVLIITVIATPVGVPLVVVGVLLVIRAIF